MGQVRIKREKKERGKRELAKSVRLRYTSVGSYARGGKGGERKEDE